MLQGAQLITDRDGETIPAAAVVNEEIGQQLPDDGWVIPFQRDEIDDPRVLRNQADRPHIRWQAV